MIKTILYALSILVILVAAFFAFSTKQKLEEQIAAYDGLRSENEQVAADIKTTESSLADTKGALGKAKDLKAELVATKDSEDSKANNYRKSIQESDASLAGYNAELDEFDKIKAQVNDLVGGLGLTLEEIPAKIEELDTQRKSQQRELERLIDLEAKLTREVANNKTEVGDLTTRLADLRQKISRGGTQGVITAVDPVWGFVVVNQGAGNSSVTERSELLVSRGGRLLGKLKVTSLEPNRAICDIDSKSFRPGVRVQTGDRITLADTAAN